MARSTKCIEGSSGTIGTSAELVGQLGRIGGGEVTSEVATHIRQGLPVLVPSGEERHHRVVGDAHCDGHPGPVPTPVHRG